MQSLRALCLPTRFNTLTRATNLLKNQVESQQNQLARFTWSWCCGLFYSLFEICLSASLSLFSPGKFKYNGRVATSLIPSLVVLAGFGGSVPVGVALVGAMVSYILDAMRFREGALLAVWLTLGIVNLSFWLTGAVFYIHEHVGLSLMIAVCIGITLFTTGIWATLQFKWVQMQYPVVVLAFEKMLLATAFTVAAMVQSWGLVAAVGASQAPFYLVPVLCALYYLLALPLTSSFHVRGARDSAIGGKVSKELQVQADTEGVAAALILVLLPASLYTVLHSSVLAEWVHLWSLLLLASLPLLFLSIVVNGLWWLPGGARLRLAARRALCLGALGTALGGLEGRLIFPAFGQYIQMPAPWNYAAVTVALYGTAALAVAFLGGLLSEDTGSMLTSSALLLSAGVGAVAAGMPLLYLAAPLVGAGGLAIFLQSRKFADYSIFVMGGAFTAAWFIYHHFWFLEIEVAGFSLQRLCITLWVGIVAALMIPGMAITKASQGILSALFLFKAVIIAAAEEQLYLGADEVQGEMYPAIMVFGTSVLGVATTHRLKSERALGHWTAWLVFSIFASKLVLLILPQERLIWPAFLFAAAVTAPLLAYQPAASSRKVRGGRLQPWQGLLHATAIVFATLVARYAIYDMLRLVLGSRPSEGLLLGMLVLVGVGGCVPLFVAHYSQWREGKRLLVLAATSGILFVLLRPPLPLQGGAVCPGWLPTALCFRLWDEAHRPEHELDDVAVWGEYGERRDRWPLWMLVGAAVTALTAATARYPATDSATKGLGYATLSGFSVGAYIALEFFPGQSVLQVVVLVATLAVAGILVGLRLRGAASPALIGLLLFTWTCGLPIGLAIQAVVPLPVLPEDAKRLFGDADILIDHQRQDSNRAALLAVYSAEALLLAFAIKLRVSAALSAAAPSLSDAGTGAAAVFRAGNAYADQAATFLGQCLPTASLAARRSGSLTGAVGGAAAQLSSEGLGWLPTAGNVVALGCLASSLVLNYHLTQASDLAIFVLSPMLVLLNQDSWFPTLDTRRRYFPSAAAVSAYLAASALVQAFTAWAAPETVANRRGSSAVGLMKNLWLAAAALPCHVHFSQFPSLVQYLWMRKRIEGKSLLLVAPLNVAVLLFSDLLVVQLLAGTAMLMAAVQYAAMRQPIFNQTALVFFLARKQQGEGVSSNARLVASSLEGVPSDW